MKFFADLHIHIGRTTRNEPVKVTASRDLTFPRILREAAFRKGIDAVGIVDCASTGVLEDIAELMRTGEMQPLSGGGLLYRDRLTVFLAAETGAEVNGREAHFLSYFPSFEAAESFSRRLRPFVTNPMLSSQRARLAASELLELTLEAGGFMIPAHVFTPHKGYFGHCASTLADGFDEAGRASLAAVELGLSADTAMASRISELDGIAFVSNSDAHSTGKIAREYNCIEAESCSFSALRDALSGAAGRVAANYGLDPRLGKYHHTWCHDCDRRVALLSSRTCPLCGGDRITVGVQDRLEEIADRPASHSDGPARPPYVHQVPLQFVPGVGPKTLERLLGEFGTEMDVLHRATAEELCSVVPEPLAESILKARTGELPLRGGGGGVYGRVERS